MEFTYRKFVRIGSLRAWRSDGGNRLLVGITRERSDDWEKLLERLGFHYAGPLSRNGHSGPLVYWVARKYPAFSPEGSQHTMGLLDALHDHVRKTSHQRSGVTTTFLFPLHF